MIESVIQVSVTRGYFIVRLSREICGRYLKMEEDLSTRN